MGQHNLPPHLRAMVRKPTDRKPPESVAANINLWHDGQQVTLTFSRECSFISFTIEQAEAQIKALQACIESLRAAQSSAASSDVLTTPASQVSS